MLRQLFNRVQVQLRVARLLVFLRWKNAARRDEKKKNSTQNGENMQCGKKKSEICHVKKSAKEKQRPCKKTSFETKISVVVLRGIFFASRFSGFLRGAFSSCRLFARRSFVCLLDVFFYFFLCLEVCLFCIFCLFVILYTVLLNCVFLSVRVVSFHVAFLGRFTFSPPSIISQFCLFEMGPFVFSLSVISSFYVAVFVFAWCYLVFLNAVFFHVFAWGFEVFFRAEFYLFSWQVESFRFFA